jgi:DNA mismatch repair protein MutS
MKQLEMSSGSAVKGNRLAAQQIALFPETNPLVEELKGLDINSLTPIEALTKLYEWKKRFVKRD